MARTVTALALLTACSGPPAPAAEPARMVAPIAPAREGAPAAARPTWSDAPVQGECRGDPCWTSPSGFRFLHPTPAGHTLESVVATRPGEAWAVGASATMVRLRRGEISRVTIPGVRTPAAVIDSVAGGDTATEMPGIDLQRFRFESIVRSAPRELLVMTEPQAVARLDGAAWSMLRPPRNSSFGDEMFGGEGGVWVLPALADTTLRRGALFVRGTTDFERGLKYPRDTVVRSGWSNGDRLWLGADDGVVMVTRKGSPLAVETLDPPHKQDVTAIWVSRDEERGLLQGRGGSLYERRGGAWVARDRITSEQGEKLSEITGFWETPDGSALWVAGSTVLRLPRGGSWQSVDLPELGRNNDSFDIFEGPRYHAIGGTGPGDVWVVGRSGIAMHHDGRGWRSLVQIATDERLREIVSLGGESWMTVSKDGVVFEGEGDRLTGRAIVEANRSIDQVLRTQDGDVLLRSYGQLFTWRDGEAEEAPLAKPFYAEAARTLDDLVAVGYDGKLERSVGGRVSKVASGTKADLEVAAFAGDTVWMAGSGVIVRRDGGGARVVHQAESDDFHAIAVRSESDIWFVGSSGDGGLALHWDGRAMRRHEGFQFHSLYGAAADAQGGLWVVGLHGALSHYDGARWENLDSGTNESLHAIHVTPRGVVIASGEGGVLIVRPTPTP